MSRRQVAAVWLVVATVGWWRGDDLATWCAILLANLWLIADEVAP